MSQIGVLEQLDAARPSMASIGTEIAHSVGACPHGAIEHFHRAGADRVLPPWHK